MLAPKEAEIKVEDKLVQMHQRQTGKQSER